MTEQLQTDYLDRNEGVQTEIHKVSQFNESSITSTNTGRISMS